MSKKSKTGRADGRRTVFLVDRHGLMRRAAAGWINRCSGLTVCGMAGGMATAFRSINRLRPDVVVSEIMRPHDLGFIRELHRRHPRLPILVFSIQDAAGYAARAREAGASGYLMKAAGGDQLVRSIRTVVRRPNQRPHRASEGPMKTNAATRARRRPRRRRILIVNGVTAWREVIASRIKGCPDLKVCGEALGEEAAFERVSTLRPSLVLTEIMRPQDLGFIRELHHRHPRLPILAFSFRDEEAYAPLALEAGARGYLMKDVDGHTLVAGIRKALNGRVALSPIMAARLGWRSHSR